VTKSIDTKWNNTRSFASSGLVIKEVGHRCAWQIRGW